MDVLYWGGGRGYYQHLSIVYNTVVPFFALITFVLVYLIVIFVISMPD